MVPCWWPWFGLTDEGVVATNCGRVFRTTFKGYEIGHIWVVVEFHDNLFWFTLAPNLTHSHVYTLLLLMDGSDFSERVEGEKQHCVRLLLNLEISILLLLSSREAEVWCNIPAPSIYSWNIKGGKIWKVSFVSAIQGWGANNKGNFILIDIFPYVTTTHLPDLPTHPDNLPEPTDNDFADSPIHCHKHWKQL